MLRITVELFPAGFEPLRRTIATMEVANVSNLADVSDYRIQATENRNYIAGLPARSVEVEVKGHDRRQSVWSLVAAAALAVVRASRHHSVRLSVLARLPQLQAPQFQARWWERWPPSSLSSSPVLVRRAVGHRFSESGVRS